MLFHTFLSSHATGDVKALCCPTVDLNLTSRPGDRLHVGVKPRVSVQGSRESQEMWLPPYSSKPVLEADFGFQRKKKGGQNQTKPCPGFPNWGLAAGGMAPKGGKVIVGTSVARAAGGWQALPCACQTA